MLSFIPRRKLEKELPKIVFTANVTTAHKKKLKEQAKSTMNRIMQHQTAQIRHDELMWNIQNARVL